MASFAGKRYASNGLAFSPQGGLPTWEYRVQPCAEGDLENDLNDLGNAGWELVVVKGRGKLVFKRPHRYVDRGTTLYCPICRHSIPKKEE